MKVVVIGTGRMGKAVAYDLVKNPRVKQIKIIEQHQDHLDKLKEWLPKDSILTEQVDITKEEDTIKALSGYDVAISCVPYKFNFDLAKMAIKAKTNFIDLGGNMDIVKKELSLHKEAVENNVLIIPDCGLAPGLVSILTKKITEELDKVEEVHLRVGGLPQKPEGELQYALLFSVEGLVNEYVEPPCMVLKDYVIDTTPPMEGLEALEISSFGKVEAFNTSGGTSTLPLTFEGDIKELDYKTIRYPGHLGKLKKIWEDVGKDPKSFGEKLKEMLPEGKEDVVVLKVWGIGEKNNEKKKIVFEIIDYYDKKTGLTAMMRTTAFPAAIVATMIGHEIKEKGVVPQEICVPTDAFLDALRSRGVIIKTL